MLYIFPFSNPVSNLWPQTAPNMIAESLNYTHFPDFASFCLFVFFLNCLSYISSFVSAPLLFSLFFSSSSAFSSDLPLFLYNTPFPKALKTTNSISKRKRYTLPLMECPFINCLSFISLKAPLNNWTCSLHSHCVLPLQILDSTAKDNIPNQPKVLSGHPETHRALQSFIIHLQST